MEKREFILRVIIAIVFLLVIIPVILLVIQRNDFLYGITSVAILATISAGVWLSFYMGRINMGQGAYALIGAYTTAVLVVQYDISFWIALFVSGFVAAFFSILIGLPILRLRGVYFSMVTLTLTVS